MNTDRNWTSENRYNDSDAAAANAVPGNIVPAWSVPPGLIDPERRAASPAEYPGQEEILDEDPPMAPADEYERETWPGVAQPARWFLRAPALHREPDGSWSTAAPAPHQDIDSTAGLSPWQRSQREWQEAGAQWQPAATETPSPTQPHPEPAVPPQVPWDEAPPQVPPTEPDWFPLLRSVDGVQVPSPLSAPVLAEADPGLDEPEDREYEYPEQDDREHDDLGRDDLDRWADDRPPIRERPASLFPRARSRPNDSLLLDLDRPRRSPMGAGAWPVLVSRRTATIAIPAVVLVSVAVLALALLMGHGPRFGQLSGNQQTSGNPHSPLTTAVLATYPGQQQRGVFQAIHRVVSSGRTMVAIGSQVSDGLVRQQFFVSADGGARWRVAPVRGPGGGQAPPGSSAELLAGGPGGWLAVGPGAIWSSAGGMSWALAAGHGIVPRRAGDGVWVITSTARGYLAAGDGQGQAVIWISRDGLAWRRLTAAQLGLAGPGETVRNIAYATYHGSATVISGQVAKAGTSYSAAWLSNDGGASWTRVAIPADHGAGPQISGLASDADGLIAVRPGVAAGGAPDGVAYFSPDGRGWQYAGTIDPAGGWTPSVVKGGNDGFAVSGTTTAGTVVAYVSSGAGGTWRPTGSLGRAGADSVTGVAVAPGGAVVAVGVSAKSGAGQRPVFAVADTAGEVRPVPLAGMAGAVVPELAVGGLAAGGGQLVAVGSADGYPAVWHQAAGGGWSLVTPLSLASSFPGLTALTGVTHGPSGWLAVGAPGPVVLTSPDGVTWRQAGGNITRDLAGVAALAAASGPVGYIIVGKLVAPGGGCVADVWWSPNLLVWTRAHDVNDATGSSQVLNVAADAHGFVSVGSHIGKPAVWTTADGTTWRTIVLPVPPGAASGVLQQIAISGNRVAALGQEIAANGGTSPLAEVSADGGTTWRQVPFAAPGPDVAFTALTAGAHGFTAAGLVGAPGQEQVAVWTSADGTRWSQANVPATAGISDITALARSGATVTGFGSIATPQSQRLVTLPLP